jgi:aspartate/tyrosine/aromatic aminotransferase
MFAHVQPAPPDPIIGLTEAYKADPNPHKINLAVGVYKDAEGKTPTLAAVRAAEQWLTDHEPNKVYLGIDGDAGYGQATRDLLFGPGHELARDTAAGGRSATFQAPGGTGALRVAADTLAALSPKSTVWLSDPTWPNHPAIFKAAGLAVKTYPYLDPATNTLARDAMADALADARPGDVVLLHGCCHNPTGIDPSAEQWSDIAALLNDRGAVPLIDFAYQGFATGLEEDAQGLRLLAGACGELIVCNSYSKNFGLYRERVGALTLVAGDNDAAKAVQSQAKAVVRRNYSNPPAHGALVVSHILSDAELTAQWHADLALMRERVARMRKLFRDTLDERGVTLGHGDNAFIQQQNGMFTMSGLTREQVDRLRAEHAVYIVGSGRVNVAGMTEQNIPVLCDAIAAVVG